MISKFFIAVILPTMVSLLFSSAVISAEPGAAMKKMAPDTSKPVFSAPPVDSSATLDSVFADSTRGWFVIQTSHRMFPSFKQIDTVFFGQRFALGEGEEDTAAVFSFNPHFSLTEKGELFQVSDTLANPAVHIRIMAKGKLLQESWGFLYIGAPHFRRNEFFGFKLIDLRVGKQYIKRPTERK